ncbi:hypothetical protein BCR35DRAFT_224500 [Leucosporidium creatinivorum]|uniref:Uncharacterized protein n=1 Tax=Leucosporidium creatinivorum TaxID=106004 RepID=A0A1Y2D6G0_9BASI|nr:hypothetical protein BCR35DRAFT_224500 [Leucosporidium creatinivorum]
MLPSSGSTRMTLVSSIPSTLPSPPSSSPLLLRLVQLIPLKYWIALALLGWAYSKFGGRETSPAKLRVQGVKQGQNYRARLLVRCLLCYRVGSGESDESRGSVAARARCSLLASRVLWRGRAM